MRELSVETREWRPGDELIRFRIEPVGRRIKFIYPGETGEALRDPLVNEPTPVCAWALEIQALDPKQDRPSR